MVDPEVLVEVPMFATLPQNERKRLAGVMREEQLPSGRILFEIGDPGSTMYFIRTGKIRISIPGDSGEEVALAVLGPGAFFGEMAVLDQQPRSARASAAGDTHLYSLEREGFLSFVGSRPDAALSMLSATVKRLRETDEIMRSRASFDVNAEFARHETRGGRWAARLAQFAGSWTFITSYFVVLVAWFALNFIFRRFGHESIDTPAYELLGLALGVIASFQAPIIMMSQNRDQLRDRLQADADFKVNQKNEVAIEKAVERLEEMRRQIPELKRQVKEHEAVIRKTHEQLKKAILRAGAGMAGAGSTEIPGTGSTAGMGTGVAPLPGTGSQAGALPQPEPSPEPRMLTPMPGPLALGDADIIVGEGTAIYMPGEVKLDESGERGAAGSRRLRASSGSGRIPVMGGDTTRGASSVGGDTTRGAAPEAGAGAATPAMPAPAPARAPSAHGLRSGPIGSDTARGSLIVDGDTPDPDADGLDDEEVDEEGEDGEATARTPLPAPATAGATGSDTLKGAGSLSEALKAFRPAEG